MLNKIGQWIANHDRYILIFIAVLTVLAAYSLWDFQTQSPRLKIDSSVDRLLPQDDPDRDFYEYSRKLFGADDVLVLALADFEIVSEQGLQQVEELTQALRRLPELRQVQSLATIPNARNQDGFLAVDVFTRMPVETEQDRQALRRDLQQNKLVFRNLISEDLKVTAFVLTMNGDPTEMLKDGEFERSLRLLAKDIAPKAKVWITGAPLVKAALTRAVVDQMRLTIPAIILLVAGILFVAFHNLRAVIMPGTTILLSLFLTLATVSLFDVSLNLVSSIMPPVVMTLGLAATMHVMSEYFAVRRTESDPNKATHITMEHIGLPLVLTSVTTAAGFIALTLNPLPAVREFAIFTSVGIFFTLALTLTLLPAMLRRAEGLGGEMKQPRGNDVFSLLATVLSGVSLRLRRPIVIIGVSLLLLGALFSFRIQVGTGYVSGFAEDHPVRQDYEAINETLGGANPFSIVLEGFVPDTFAEPEILRAMESLQAWLEEQPEVGATQSLVDHLKLINRGFNEGDAQFDRIPESRSEAKQLLMFGGSSALNSLVDKRFATAQIIVRARVEDSAAIKSLVDRINERLDRLPRRLDATVTGNTVLITDTVEDIASGQWLSIGIAALVVYIVLSMLFTSWRVGLIALLPNLLPVSIYFGTLGLLGITLNPTTSLIACIVLGVAVDDTIHFLARFNSEARAHGDEKTALANALRKTLRPVTFTTIALCSGFLVLCFSPLQNQVQFGALAAFTLLMAWVTDVLFTPALGSGVRIVTLWDVLRLDLGEDPHLSIPLLKDLSSREARTFALLSDLQTFKAGERLITEGEDAHDIYVIVEGELQAWLDRDGERRNLSVMRRGAVMGEVGLFGSKRTANVDALSAARLLKFNGDDLERLRSRYPRIAATIYRNLNLIQARRLLETTKLVQ